MGISHGRGANFIIHAHQDGASLVEVLVAVAILAIISAPIFGAFMVARSAQAESTGRVIAQSLARTRLEALQQTAHLDWTLVTSQPEAPDTDYPGHRVKVDVTPITVGTTVALKDVTVTVTWTGAKQRELKHQIATRMERRK